MQRTMALLQPCVSLMMALPALMVFLSVALRAPLNRVLNIIVGALYTAIITVTMWAGPKHFVALPLPQGMHNDAPKGRLLQRTRAK